MKRDTLGFALKVWAEYALDGDTWSDDGGDGGVWNYAVGRGDHVQCDYVSEHVSASWNDHQVRSSIRGLAALEDRERKPWSFVPAPVRRSTARPARRYGGRPRRKPAPEIVVVQESSLVIAPDRLVLLPWNLLDSEGPVLPDMERRVRVLTETATSAIGGVALSEYTTQETSTEHHHPAHISARTLANAGLRLLTGMAMRVYEPEMVAWAHVTARAIAEEPAMLSSLAIAPQAAEAWILRPVMPGEPGDEIILDPTSLAQIEILPFVDANGMILAFSPVMSIAGAIFSGERVAIE